MELGALCIQHLVQLALQERQHALDEVDHPREVLLAKHGDDHDGLQMRLHDRLADERGGEELTERDEEVAAGDAGEIEQRVGHRGEE